MAEIENQLSARGMSANNVQRCHFNYDVYFADAFRSASKETWARHKYTLKPNALNF